MYILLAHYYWLFLCHSLIISKWSSKPQLLSTLFSQLHCPVPTLLNRIFQVKLAYLLSFNSSNRNVWEKMCLGTSTSHHISHTLFLITKLFVIFADFTYFSNYNVKSLKQYLSIWSVLLKLSPTKLNSKTFFQQGIYLIE